MIQDTNISKYVSVDDHFWASDEGEFNVRIAQYDINIFFREEGLLPHVFRAIESIRTFFPQV